MTRLPGRLDVTPADPEGWLRQIAAMAVRIHDVQVAAGPFEARIDAAAFTTNGWRQVIAEQTLIQLQGADLKYAILQPLIGVVAESDARVIGSIQSPR